jgi:acetyl-CoA carboxylase biotin carboxylase subunit
MNTRLQVEHPITEEVWGLDLARKMIQAALGEPLGFRADDLAPRGHAIECRVYAEDPSRGFTPSPGTVTRLRLPEGPGVRNDVGIESGSGVPIDYDPMLGKLVVHGADRANAIERLARALGEYEIAGVETTLPLFRALVRDSAFRAAEFHTQWLDEWLVGRNLGPPEATAEEAILAAAGVSTDGGAPAISSRSDRGSRWREAARVEALRSRLERSRGSPR